MPVQDLLPLSPIIIRIKHHTKVSFNYCIWASLHSVVNKMCALWLCSICCSTIRKNILSICIIQKCTMRNFGNVYTNKLNFFLFFFIECLNSDILHENALNSNLKKKGEMWHGGKHCYAAWYLHWYVVHISSMVMTII